MLVNFFIIQTAPGGPVERLINSLNRPTQTIGEAAITNHNFSLSSNQQNIDVKYRGSQGLDPELISKIEKLYGFDKPLWQRFWDMMVKYLKFDFGNSFYQDKSVTSLVAERLPVSISLGLWSTLLVYLISIPLGIKKAVNNGSRFDIASSTVIVIGYAIPSFLFAILLIVLFCGGNFFSVFPLRGLVSDGFSSFTWYQKIADYFWHLFLPILSMVVGGFAGLTFLCKNSFLEEINKQYVLAARAKGLAYNQILYRHIFRNAMLIVIAGFPSALIAIFFTSGLLIEIIFSLNGIGLLGFEAAVSRDYPLMFGTLYFFTLLGLITTIIGDITYKLIDPRINFESRNN